jgi:threonine dehydrogenase-like Zn-dependent dehydrogenase
MNMGLHKFFLDNFNIQTITGKILWGVIASIMGYIWRRFKAQPNSVRREIALSVTAVIAIVLTLTLVNQISTLNERTAKEGFKASIICCGPMGTMVITNMNTVNATNIIVTTISSDNAATTKAGSGISMLFIVRVVNPGAPSVAWNWKASVVLLGGSKLDATIPGVVMAQNQSTPTIVGPFTATAENNLLQALASRRLETGASIMGWFVVHVNGIDSAPEGAHFIVTFDDAFGNQTTIDDCWIPGH